MIKVHFKMAVKVIMMIMMMRIIMEIWKQSFADSKFVFANSKIRKFYRKPPVLEFQIY